jgi:CAAX prenyl protease-like protein
MPPASRRDAFYRIAPFAVFIALIAFESGIAHSPYKDAADWRWLAIGRGLAAAALLALFWRHYSELRRPASRPGALDWAIAVVAGFAVFGAWITFDSGWAVFGGEGKGFAPLRADGSIDWVLAGLRLFVLAAVVPVMEELFWRSFLLRWIASPRDFLGVHPRNAGLAAFAISSGLFASEHSLWFAGLIAGLVYAGVYARTGNLWLPIVSHAITNGTLGLWILATRNWQFW